MMTRKDFLIGAASTAATASAIDGESIEGGWGRARGLLGGAFMGVMLAQQGSSLPYMRRVASLSTATKSWVDSLVVANQNTSVEMDVIVTGTGSNQGLFGKLESNKRFEVITYYQSSPCFEAGISGVYATGNNKVPYQAGARYKILLSKNGFYVDGVKKWSPTSVADFSHSASFPICKFAYTDSYGGFNGKVFGCKIWQGQNLIRDLIPVLDLEGRPCLYNQASTGATVDDTSRFFYNQGTEEFAWDEF